MQIQADVTMGEGVFFFKKNIRMVDESKVSHIHEAYVKYEMKHSSYEIQGYHIQIAKIWSISTENRQLASPGLLQPRSYSSNKIATLKHVFQTVLSS